jgi:dTDP-4-dehydrorhamnose reductase
MKIVIAGAGGLVGGACARELCARHEVLALTRRELDITAAEDCARLLRAERPQLVINCTVLGVDECERDPAWAQAVNADGPCALARLTNEVNADFLHFSTNYVFDGRAAPAAGYTVADEPRPISVYGRTKLAGERAVRAVAPRSFIVRTSWVFGADKENFFSMMPRRLRAGERVRAARDVTANTTYVVDLVARVAEILARRHYATYHVVNEGICSYADFARAAARCVGLSDAEAARLIEVVDEAALARRAPRPCHTPLRCLVSAQLGRAPLRDWRAALADYIQHDATATVQLPAD